MNSEIGMLGMTECNVVSMCVFLDYSGNLYKSDSVESKIVL